MSERREEFEIPPHARAGLEQAPRVSAGRSRELRKARPILAENGTEVHNVRSVWAGKREFQQPRYVWTGKELVPHSTRHVGGKRKTVSATTPYTTRKKREP